LSALTGNAAPALGTLGAPASRYFADDALVLQGMPTQSGVPSTLQFADDVWRMREAVLVPSMVDVPLLIDFTRIPASAVALTLKEFAFARLRYAAGGYKKAKPATVASNGAGLIRTFEDLCVHEQLAAMQDLTQDMLDRWKERTMTSGGRTVTAARVYELSVLYGYREWQTDPLPINPWRGRSTRRVTGTSHGGNMGENVTPRIPEEVASPLLRWSLRYVQDFAEEITVAVGDAMPAAASVPVAQPWRRTDRLTAYLTTLRETGRGLPSLSPALAPDDAARSAFLAERRRMSVEGWSPTAEGRGADARPLLDNELAIAVTYISKAAGLKGATNPAEIREQLYAALQDVGLDWQRDAGRGMESLAALRRGGLVDPVAWTEASMLMTAVFIVVAYLTGMRDSEVQDMRRGCLRRVRGADGVTERWMIKSRVYKGRGALGDPEEWVAIDEVASAIAALDRLHDTLGSPPNAYLFTRHLTRASKGIRQDTPLGQGASGLILKFRDHVNALATRSSITPAIPDHQGRPWPISPRQFRRTLAWHIVNRPFGTVAGMRHFKHVRLQITEGYGGLSASGFADEIEAERQLSGLDALVERYQDWEQGVRLAGPGATALEREFKAIHETGGGGPMVADEARLRALLKHRAKHLHPGLLNDCSFDPNHAACGGVTGPKREACRPGGCANSYITPEHKRRWAEHGAELDQYLTHRDQLPLVQIQRIERARDVVSQVMAADTPHEQFAQ